jgi:hypothetical protein
MTPGYFTASGGIGSAWGAPVPAHVPEAGRAPPPGQDVERWARMTAERVRTWVVGGMLAFPPWLDNYTEETEAHRRAYRQMFAEPVVHAATMANVYSVAELEVQTHPQDPENPREQEAAEFVGHALRTVRGGVVGLVTALLTGALIDGWSLVEPVWEPVTEGKYRGKWAWRAVKAKDVRHLTPLVDGFLNVIGIRSQAGLLGLRVFDPADFLLYRNLSLFESPRGLSDYRAAYRAWWIMATAWRLRALGLERWSQPSLKGTYTDEGQHRQALEAALAGYQANTWLTVPLGCTVDAIDIANRGESDFKSAIADLREEMAIACSYATLTILTSAQTNPRGDSEVQKTTTQLKQWGLAANVGAVLTEQAAPPLTRLNYPGVPPCTVTLGAVDEGALSARLRNDTGLVKDLGLKLSRKESYRYYGRQQPAGPDDELGGPSAPPPKPPPGGNGPGNGAAGGPPAPPFAETFAEERGGEFKKGGGRVAAGPHTETTRALLAAHPVPADRGTLEGARGWRRSVAAQAAHDVLHAGPVREVPPDAGNPVKAALHAAAVHDAAEFHRDMLQGPRADEVAAAHPQGKAAVDEARRVAGDRHRRAAAQVSERLGELARSLPAPQDRPLTRADLSKGHVIEPSEVDEALRPAVEHLAARIPHATVGDAAVAVADTPEARKALLVLRQLGAVQPLGEGTAEARAAREKVTGSLTDEERQALPGGPGAGFVSAAGVSRGVIPDAPHTSIPGHDTFRNRVTPPERVPGVPKTKKARQELAKSLRDAHTEARNALVKKYGTGDVESAMTPEERALDSHLFFSAELVATGRGREGPTDLGPVGDEHYARHYRNAVRALDQLRRLAATPTTTRGPA